VSQYPDVLQSYFHLYLIAAVEEKHTFN